MSSRSPSPAPGPGTADPALTLADWRRRVGDLYAAAREAMPADAGDGRAAWAAWRTGRDALFRTHAQSPLDAAARARFTGLPYFAYDPALHFLVETRPCADGAPVELELGADGRIVLEPRLRTAGLAGALGSELTVYWIAGYGGGLFLPFADATGGGETYGGGRYLLDTIKGADLGCRDGRLLLDFNFAYNPSCAYDPRWTCPLAPPENRLPVAVRAGERAPHTGMSTAAHGPQT